MNAEELRSIAMICTERRPDADVRSNALKWRWKASEAQIRGLMSQTDRVAEIQNTLRLHSNMAAQQSVQQAGIQHDGKEK